MRVAKGIKLNLSESERKRRGDTLRKYRKSPNIKWTNEKINTCFTIIKRNPDNLQHAFRIAANEIGVTSRAIHFQYYAKSGKLYKYRQNKYIFGIFSIMPFLGKILPQKFFGKQVKNNIKKGKISL